MNIQIKDLGAVKDAIINLENKLIIFCGPNGTGKTYLAYVLYSLTKIENKSIGIRLKENTLKDLFEYNSTMIPLDFESIWNFRIKEVESVRGNLWNLFAVPESKSKDFFSKTEIDFLETKEVFLKKMEDLELNENLKIYDYHLTIKKESNSQSVKLIIADNTVKNSEFFDFLEIVVLSRIFTLLAYYPIVSSTIFPVERNSIYTFSNELSIRKNDALDHIEAVTNKKDFNMLDLLFKRKTRYPKPIRDGLEVAEDLDNIQKRNSDYFAFATEIENDLLKGKVSINKDGNVEFSSHKAPKIKLSFHQSSSIVKTLSSLVIYLKHRATKNDLVIIDEPELNLHPDNQVKLARLFSRLVNNGLRLLISTHSDYIVREFNNLIMISSNNESIKHIAERFNYKNDEYLNQNDVGAYMFNFKNNTSRQTEVKLIKIDETGFEVDTLDKTIDDLNHVSDKLYYTLKYGESTSD
jgi:ABC-type multidrug transport system ATPase subunit